MKNPVCTVLKPVSRPAPRRAPAAHGGFTLLELIIAVAILGILVAIGVPSFGNIIRQNRLAGQTNSIIQAAAIARNEAVKRGSPVSLCSATANVNNDACAGADDQWNNGWLVFSDENSNGVIDAATDMVIQRWPAPTDQSINVDTTPTIAQFMTYRGDGATTLAPGSANAVMFTVVPQPCINPLGARTVTIIPAGRANSARINCP